jgi:Domain of unknown function (DUF397)
MSDRAPMGDNEGERDTEDWRKSSYSMSNGHCLEAARLVSGRIGVRDSKAADGLVLDFEPAIWSAFLAELQTAHPPRSHS